MTIEDELHNAAPAKLTVDRVTKVYRGKRQDVKALDDVSLTVGEGEFVCLLGPSGCGKTTTLRMIAGFSSGDLNCDKARACACESERFLERTSNPARDQPGNADK